MLCNVSVELGQRPGRVLFEDGSVSIVRGNVQSDGVPALDGDLGPAVEACLVIESGGKARAITMPAHRFEKASCLPDQPTIDKPHEEPGCGLDIAALGLSGFRGVEGGQGRAVEIRVDIFSFPKDIGPEAVLPATELFCGRVRRRVTQRVVETEPMPRMQRKSSRDRLLDRRVCGNA